MILGGIFWTIILKNHRDNADNPGMNPKMLIVLAWIFYLLRQHTADSLWLFCMVYCCVLAVCVFFYRMENRTPEASPDGKQN